MEIDDEKIADDFLEEVRHGDKNSFHELEKLAEDGNARAMSNLAQIYLKGLGIVESSYEKAVALFRKAAALDEVYALFRLGEFYRDATHGFKQDGNIAAEYFIRAAENATPNGAAEGLRLAAEIYHYGKGGVAPDGSKAIELYKQLDEIESLDEIKTCKALFRIAEIYTEGCGSLKPDGLKAVEYLNKAAERGDDQSAFHELAEMYRKGKGGLKIDGCKVIEYLTKLDDLETIAEIYRNGKYNVKADGCKAVEYLLKAIDFERAHPNQNSQSNISSDYNKIAWIYLKGKAGVQVDGYKAIEYFKKLSDFKKIAEIYRHGKGGVEPNPLKAVEYFLKDEAASRCPDDETDEFYISLTNERRADAFRNVAEIYFKLNDGQKALEYFLKADALGDSDSDSWIERLYHKGKGTLPPDGVKLVEFLMKKLEQGKSSAKRILYEIAAVYETGCGSLLPNRKQALEFYGKSAAIGNDYAKERLSELTDSDE